MKVLRKLRMAMAISSLLLIVGACGRQDIGVDGYYRGNSVYGSCDVNATGENVYDGTITQEVVTNFGYVTQGSVKLTVIPTGGMVSGLSASAVLNINGAQFCCTSQGMAGTFLPPEYPNEKAVIRGVTLVCNPVSGGTGYFNTGYQAITLVIGVPAPVDTYQEGKASLRTDQRLQGIIEISTGSQIVMQMPSSSQYFVK